MNKVPQITSFLQTRIHKQGYMTHERTSSIGVLLPYFKSSKGISCTSFRCGVLNKIHLWFFPQDLLNARRQRNYYQQALYEDNFSTCPPPRILFWFMSSGFLKRPVLLKYWLLRPFFYVEATCKSSTIKGLLYTTKAVPSKDHFTHLTLKNGRKGAWVISLDYPASHPQHFCADWGHSRSKIWHPLGLTLWRMLYGRGMSRIPLQRIL